MTARCAAAVFAGVACAASFSGAYGALTTTTAWCSWCVTAFAMTTIRDRKTLMWFAGGAAAGSALPTIPPQPAGAVVTRAPGIAAPGDLFALLDRIDQDPAAVVGGRATVSGTWTPASAGMPATVSRRIMSCCAADAVLVGFDVVQAQRAGIAAGTWVRVAGIVRSRIVDGELRYGLESATLCWKSNGTPKARSARPRRGPAGKLSATPCG